MKKVILSFICVSFLVPQITFSVSKKTIQAFFDNSHSTFLDYHWLTPREIYNDTSNASRTTVSHLITQYHSKEVPNRMFENIGDYLDDKPLTWKHHLNFYTIFYQGNEKKLDNPIFNDYELKTTVDGDLRIIHKKFGFTIGTFRETGQFRAINYDRNHLIDAGFWMQVYYDPWENHMFYKKVLLPTRHTRVDYPSQNTEHFYFRFKDDTSLRLGSIEVKSIAGFKPAVAVFRYENRIKPIAKVLDVKMIHLDKKVTFDIWFEYDPRLLWIDAFSGVVSFNMTRDEFLSPEN